MNNLERLTDWLRFLQEPGNGSAAAKLSVGGATEGYIYLRTSFDQFLLYAEVVLEQAGDQPTGALWQQLGWNPPTPGDRYVYRTWRVVYDADRLAVARQLEQALAYGFGADQDHAVIIELLLN